jgi:hypothetical protein
MILKEQNILLILLLVVFVPSFLFAQTKIDFSDNQIEDSVDYISFYPALMLKHTIGPFYKLPKNPVLSPSRSGWDNEDVADPFVLVMADSILLFYDGGTKGHYSIGYAIRDKDGWGWVNRKQILQSDSQNWRSFHLIAPTIIPGKSNLLVYNGNSSDLELGYQTGVAQKNSLGNWSFSTNTSLFENNSDNWDFAGNAYQDIVYIPNQKSYKMWYSGFSGPFARIGLAESTDGTSWDKILNKPVFESSPGVIAPEVVFNGEHYTMYFAHLNFNHGFGTEIKSAQSKDGVKWENIETILRPEAKWEGKRLMRPNISFFEEQVHLFYCAQRGSNWQIGEAIADATFQSSGRWLSGDIKNKYSKLVIKYEQPYQTNTLIELQDIENGISQALDLELNKQELRTNVYKTFLSIDKGLKSFKINIKFSTENEFRSPVIYEMVLLE